MDVICHRNCLDGSFSAYLLYLLSLTIQESQLKTLVKLLHHQDIKECQFNINNPIDPIISQTKKTSLTQSSFTLKLNQLFNYLSFTAGQFLPLSPSNSNTNNKVLFIVDITPNTQYLQTLLNKYQHVMVIDHHHSFIKFVQSIPLYPTHLISKLTYIYNDDNCASKLTYQFINAVFKFKKRLDEQLIHGLQRMLVYVNKNDLKRQQDRESKVFVLGFYYLEIELSHQNPWLFKRLYQLNIDYIFEKGANKYKYHLQTIVYQVNNASIFMIDKGKYKGCKCLGTDPKQKSIISDLGIVLSYLSVKLGLLNLAILINKRNKQTRLSLRSSQSITQQPPMALTIAQQFGGGGHVCAAGCMLKQNTFKNSLKFMGAPKPKLSICTQQVQSIIFYTNK